MLILLGWRMRLLRSFYILGSECYFNEADGWLCFEEYGLCMGRLMTKGGLLLSLLMVNRRGEVIYEGIWY